MKKPVSKRTNEDWLRALRGEIPGDAAIEELRDYLAGYLSRLSSGRGSLHDNDDIPPDSNYRDVRPMALTIKRTQGELSATPWEIDYSRYQSPELNAFKERAPEIDITGH